MNEIKKYVRYTDESVLNIKSEASAAEAAIRMRDEGLGALIVVKAGEYIGIVTETDFARKIVADGLDPKKTKVEFIMNNPIILIESHQSMASAFLKMGKHKIRNLAVIEEGLIIGILTIREFIAYYTKKFRKPKK